MRYKKLRPCEKCGHEVHKDEYQPPIAHGLRDYIRRTCGNCGYVWLEEALELRQVDK